jgi:competence protein ComEC
MIANHKGEIPFVVLLAPFLLGLITGLNLLTTAWIMPLSIAFAAISIIFIAFNLFYKSLQLYRLKWPGGLLLHLVLFLGGCVIILNYNELSRNDHFSKCKAKYLVVRVESEPVSKNGYIRFRSSVIRNINNNKLTPTSGNLLISIKDSLAKSVQYGDELLIPANYTPLDPPFNPAEFNYKRYLADQNIHYQSFLFQRQYTLIAHNTGNPVIAFALNLRWRLVAKLKAGIHDPQATAIASTMLLGYRTDLSGDVLQAYSQTGTIYVLTVSGAQIAVIYFLLNWLLGFLNRYRYGKLLRAVIIISVLWYYALLTGFSVSVCRAVLMVSLIVAGKTFNRYINSLNLLAVSALALLLYDPLFITDVGFQLAYIAVAGLIILRPIVYKLFKFRNKISDKLWELCSVSIAAQVVTFPLSAFYFHQFPVYFLASNLLAFIPAVIIMYAGMIYLLLPPIPVISKALGLVIEQTAILMNKALAVMAHFPFASINKIWLDHAEYLLLYAIIMAGFAFLYYRRTRALQIGLICLLLLTISTSYKKIAAIRSNNIVFLNLRKHTGIIMRKGDSAIVLSDLTDTDKNYQYSIQPYLDSCKVENARIYKPDESFVSSFAVKQFNYIQFLNKSILLFDKHISNIVSGQRLTVDYIYLSGNPNAVLNSFGKNFNCSRLVINADNGDHFVNETENRAKAINLNFTLLKRNNSLIAVSNE